jgi:hypothetical protein
MTSKNRLDNISREVETIRKQQQEILEKFKNKKQCD